MLTFYLADTELAVAVLNLTSSRETIWRQRSCLFLCNNLKKKKNKTKLLHCQIHIKLPGVECLDREPQFLYSESRNLAMWLGHCSHQEMDANFLPIKSGFAFCLASANRTQWKWLWPSALRLQKVFLCLCLLLSCKTVQLRREQLGLSAGWGTRGTEMHLRSWDHSGPTTDAQQLGSSQHMIELSWTRRLTSEDQPRSPDHWSMKWVNGNCLKLPGWGWFIRQQKLTKSPPSHFVGLRGSGFENRWAKWGRGQGWKKNGSLRRKRRRVLVSKQFCTF